ncbi:MAG: hypothetical protein VX807_09510, partial [Pseudomonadota bacterium]|nr:hypothetical protein [Pseudomonadota bacterium]
KHNCKNYYTELLGAVANSDSIIYIPGESTSMISEALSVIPAEKIYIYDTDSMSEAHHKHVKYTADKFPIFHLKLSEAKDLYTRCHTCNSTTDKYDYNASKHIALASKDILEFENEKITPSIRP